MAITKSEYQPNQTETIQLSKNQKKKAKELAQRSQRQKTPLEYTENWYALNNDAIQWIEEKGEQIEKVNPEKIVGTSPQNIYRFEPFRFQKILKNLYQGKWKKEPCKTDLISLKKVGNHYYINSDGTHRTLAFKSLNIEKINAKLEYYEIKHEAGIPHRHLRNSNGVKNQ